MVLPRPTSSARIAAPHAPQRAAGRLQLVVERREPQRGQGQEGLEPGLLHTGTASSTSTTPAGRPETRRPAGPGAVRTEPARPAESRGHSGPATVRPPPRRYGHLWCHAAPTSFRPSGRDRQCRPAGRASAPETVVRPDPRRASDRSGWGVPAGQAPPRGPDPRVRRRFGRHSRRGSDSKALRRRDEGSGARSAGETLRESEAR